MRSTIPSRVSGAASFAQRAVKGGIAEPVMINPLWSAPARWTGTKGERAWCPRIVPPQSLAAFRDRSRRLRWELVAEAALWFDLVAEAALWFAGSCSVNGNIYIINNSRNCHT
jgi:hypothetical protein